MQLKELIRAVSIVAGLALVPCGSVPALAQVFAPTNPSVKCPKGPYTLEETSPRIVPHAYK